AWWRAMRCRRSPSRKASRALRMLASATSSTNTCGASRTSARTGRSAAWMRAISDGASIALERAHRPVGGVDESDRRAVAVPDEDRLVDPNRLQQRGQHVKRLLVHEA